MSGTPNPPIPGHHLIGEGSIFPVWGEGWGSVKSHTGGCECGAKPPEFPNLSRNKMKAWHREHKAELRAQGIGANPTDRTDRTRILYQVLDAAEDALRMGDVDKVVKVVFVWSQRREHLLAGEETWDDQHI